MVLESDACRRREIKEDRDFVLYALWEKRVFRTKKSEKM